MPLPTTPTSATRYLFHSRPAGRITCLFQGRIQMRGRGAHDRIAPYLPAEELRNDGRGPIWGLTVIMAGAVTIRDRTTQQSIRLTAGSWFQFLDRPAQSIALENPTPDFQEAAISCDRNTGTHLAQSGLWRQDPWHHPANHPTPDTPPDPALIAACLDLHHALIQLHIGTPGLLRRLAHVLELAYAHIDNDGADDSDAGGDLRDFLTTSRGEVRDNILTHVITDVQSSVRGPVHPDARTPVGTDAHTSVHTHARLKSRADFRRQACRILAAHPEPTFAITDAARQLGLGVENFRKKFKTIVGIAPGAWHLHRRIERASTLLATMSVVETAKILGYPDAFALSRQFKRVTGVSPKSLRR